VAPWCVRSVGQWFDALPIPAPVRPPYPDNPFLINFLLTLPFIRPFYLFVVIVVRVVSNAHKSRVSDPENDDDHDDHDDQKRVFSNTTAVDFHTITLEVFWLV
jgi:hypothetical protein